MTEKLTLLRAAVAAKVRYWDATLNLERALIADGDPTDQQSDKMLSTIENLAVGVDDPACADTVVTEEHLAELEQCL